MTRVILYLNKKEKAELFCLLFGGLDNLRRSFLHRKILTKKDYNSIKRIIKNTMVITSSLYHSSKQRKKRIERLNYTAYMYKFYKALKYKVKYKKIRINFNLDKIKIDNHNKKYPL